METIQRSESLKIGFGYQVEGYAHAYNFDESHQSLRHSNGNDESINGRSGKNDS